MNQGQHHTDTKQEKKIARKLQISLMNIDSKILKCVNKINPKTYERLIIHDNKVRFFWEMQI